MWDGVERRSNIRYCDAHIKLCEDVAIIKTTVLNLDKRINGSIDAIEKHIENGSKWRMTIAGVAIVLAISIINGIVHNAKTLKQVEVNTSRLDKIEDLYTRLVSK